MKRGPSAIREVTCISWGNAQDAKTWSNIPHFLVSSLTAHGLVVNTVDLSKNQFLFEKVGNLVNKILSRIMKQYIFFDYSRTILFDLIVNRKLKKVAKEFNTTDLFICLSFSYSMKEFTDTKVVMLCDWTIEYAIKTFSHRSPFWFEKHAINRQNYLMGDADFVITLFPDVKRYYQEKFDRIRYIGNVVNSPVIASDAVEGLIKSKFMCNKILFIGKESYLNGLIPLMESIEIINNLVPIRLDVIGMKEKLKKKKSNNIIFHGYLDKSNTQQESKYYALVSEAKVIVNVTPEWAGFSSMIECMYYGTPVIVTKYKNFVDTFGDPIPFGFYCNNEVPNIVQSIIKILEMNYETYHGLANSAHVATSEFSWQSYVKKLLNMLE
ncbi:MAG: hypothetical protein CVU90_15265 [Firmicutes bacterium HGW-Firmicutes-15]|jgi:glycosyltransferase involved in cell wall biosynthesis|nr:MAG: hypothetical protein CVV46_13840 [Spirochaetae bacterium HGW-Spirochaetae-2]PKM75902.1 MAG: hypothetical protein CVU90_15265 [Firmicutes bacterium HGW-Firmicutes-15]